MCEGDTIQPAVIEDLLPAGRPKPAPTGGSRQTPAKPVKKAAGRKRG